MEGETELYEQSSHAPVNLSWKGPSSICIQLELSSDDPENVARLSQLDAQAPVFHPMRDAALAARIRFRDVLQDEELRKPSYPP